MPGPEEAPFVTAAPRRLRRHRLLLFRLRLAFIALAIAIVLLSTAAVPAAQPEPALATSATIRQSERLIA